MAMDWKAANLPAGDAGPVEPPSVSLGKAGKCGRKAPDITPGAVFEDLVSMPPIRQSVALPRRRRRIDRLFGPR